MMVVERLNKTFKKVRAVKDLSFEVGRGEVLGMIGPNGAGKTTTLRCMCTLLRPDSGRIALNGKELAKDPVGAKEGLAYVPEIPNPFLFLTVDEHIMFTARFYKLNDWKEQAEVMLERMDLLDKRDEITQHLSKGQKQKVNIICSFLYRPNIILLDEPLYGIDPRGGRYLKDLVRSARKWGAGIIVSSHMLDLVEELADRVLIMHRGEKMAEGTIDEIRKKVKVGEGKRLEDVFLAVTEGAGDGKDDVRGNGDVGKKKRNTPHRKETPRRMPNVSAPAFLD